MNAGDRANGFHDGIRYAVSWLHDRANEMNDPWAKAVLNVTANDLGKLGKDRKQEAKANLLAICLDRASQQLGNTSK